MSVSGAVPGRMPGVGPVGVRVANDGVGEDYLANFGGESGKEGRGELRIYVRPGGDEGDGGGFGGGAEGAAMFDVGEGGGGGRFVGHIVLMALDYRHGKDLVEEVHWQ